MIVLQSESGGIARNRLHQRKQSGVADGPHGRQRAVPAEPDGENGVV